MIFHEELIPKILAGEKCVTRRPVRYEDTGFEIRPRPCKYKVGRTYAVQPVIEEGPGKGRGGKGIARIRIFDVERMPLIRIDANDARREGFRTAGEFRRYWVGLYGSYDPSQLVDRIEFELVEGSAVER